MIRHRLRWGVIRRWTLHSDLDEPLVNVLHFLIPELRAPNKFRIVRQQAGVVFQVRTATAGVGDDRVKFLWRNLADGCARQLAGELQFAIMGVKRAAALLLARGHDFAAIAREDLNGIPIDITEDEVLGTAR